MVSIIITSFKEPKSIGKAIKCVADPKYSGISGEYEIIQASPDEETLGAGQKAADELNLGDKFIQIQDPRKGKPAGLQKAFEEAKGDILVLTDGDVFYEKNAVSELLKPFIDPKIGGVCGRPVVTNDRNTLMGFFGAFFVAAADKKRRQLFNEKKDNWYTSDAFFPMSGYIMAMRKPDFKLPADTLVDDTYNSLMTFKSGYKLAYAPDAIVHTNFVTNFSDYLKQRRRTIRGHLELKKYPELPDVKSSRGFLDELRFAFFPFKFAEKPKEYLWALLLYPLRLITWFPVLKAEIFGDKEMKSTGWTRIESTK